MSYFPPTGSIVAFQSDPTKLVGTVSVVGQVGASVIGLTPVGLNVAGAPVTTANPVAVQPPASGNFPVSQSGAWTVSVVGGVSVLGGSISLAPTSVAVLQGTNPWTVTGFPTTQNISGSVFAVGSITALQGTNPWITVIQNASIAGTYAEDVAHGAGERGLFTLGVRNDNVASFVSANGDYTPIGVDSAGRNLVKPFAAEEARVEGYHSVVSTSVTTLVAAAGAGLRNYITDVMVANTGASTTLITFKDGAGSILGYTIAPAGGGSNLPGLSTPIRTGANASFDFQAATASSIVYATVKGYKAP